MKKVLSVCLLALCMILVASCSGERAKSETTTTQKPVVSTEPVPTFAVDDTNKQIPNPCEVISIEHVGSVVSGATVRGPILQTTLAASKTCEWYVGDKETPKLGVSIALSPTFFDGTEAEKQESTKLGDKSYIVKQYSTALGGSNCGRTIFVTSKNYSLSVAACLAGNKTPSTKQLSELAKDVVNSLP